MINGKKIGFYANGTFQSFPIEKTCEILKKIGYDAVELDRWWLKRCETDAELLRQCREIEKSGLCLSEVILQLDYIEPDESVRRENIEQTKAYIRRCSETGISTVNLFTGPRPWIPNRIIVGESLTQSQAWSMLFEAFDELVPLAEATGVSLAVENVWGMLCHEFFSAQYLINYYNSPYLGVNFDPSHDLLAGNTDMEFLLRQWGAERIKHIHLKDAAGSQMRGKVLFPPLGEGYVDWSGFVRGLEAIGYDGVMSVEYEADGHLNRYLAGNWVKAAEESYAALQILM